MKHRPTFCFIDLSHLPAIYLVFIWAKKNVEDQADTAFSNRSWWAKFLNKTRTTKTHPIQQNRMFLWLPRNTILWTPLFFFFVKNRGPKSWEVHIFRFGRKFDVLVTVSATEAFVGDPVQIQTEKSGSQRGWQAETFSDFERSFLSKNQRIFCCFFFGGSFFVENTMDETSIHLVETSIFFVKIIWP